MDGDPLKEIKQRSSELHQLQSAALSRAIKISESMATTNRVDCTDLAPRYQYGTGILQVANVLESRGDDTRRFSATQVTRLRTLLTSRKVPVLTNHLGTT